MNIHSGPKAFVLGHPITHSKSPALHTAANAILGSQIVYDRRDVDEQSLSREWRLLTENLDVRGLSITMPLKSAIIGYLDELTPFARAVGVVNTVFWREGKAIGHNTDVSGIVNALNDAGAKPHSGSKFAIWGGGGTAVAALAAMAYMGAETVHVYAREKNRTQGVQNVAKFVGTTFVFHDIKDAGIDAHRYDVIVSTLPAGAADKILEPSLPVRPHAVFLDVSYSVWPSPVASQYSALGGTSVSGLEMLMHQALDQVKLFNGFELDQRLPDEMKILESMCHSVGLPPRTQPPVQVFDAAKLINTGD